MSAYQEKVWERSQRGLTASQIAKELGKSTGSVRGTLSQMRKRNGGYQAIYVESMEGPGEDLLDRITREIREERNRLDEALAAIS